MTEPAPGGAVVVEGVEVALSGTPILRGVSLRVEPGEAIALLGPSGSGKTTLLRLIAGLAVPDRGRVTVQGADAAHAAARARVGFVMQEGALFPHLTLSDNVTLVARLRGHGRDRIRQRLEDVCALARIDPAWLPRFPSELSGGQRQRGGLARALFTDPSVLLFDEPLSALDPLVRAELQEELAALSSRLHKTLVFVTHDVAEACRLAPRLVLLADGLVAGAGTLAELRASPTGSFVQRFMSAHPGLPAGAP